MHLKNQQIPWVVEMSESIDDSDIYTVEDKPCSRCDEQHDNGECGRDNPDPDVLYDEMHTLD